MSRRISWKVSVHFFTISLDRCCAEAKEGNVVQCCFRQFGNKGRMDSNKFNLNMKNWQSLLNLLSFEFVVLDTEVFRVFRVFRMILKTTLFPVGNQNFFRAVY